MTNQTRDGHEETVSIHRDMYDATDDYRIVTEDEWRSLVERCERLRRFAADQITIRRNGIYSWTGLGPLGIHDGDLIDNLQTEEATATAPDTVAQ